MKEKTINKPLLIILTLFLLITSIFSTLNLPTVYALNKTVYSDVLADLKKDENFNQDKYIEDSTNVSLSVIQIAESESKELFVYVYQPCLREDLDLTATTISISTAINNNAKWELYNLSLINQNGTLLKYKVENLIVKDDALRYYDIPEIHRKFIKGVDEEPGNDNTINEVAFPVSTLWTVSTVDNKVTYTHKKSDEVIITNKFVDFLRYSQASWFGGLDVDSHYVAFSTDHNIDALKEVDISWETRTFKDTYTLDIGGEQICSENILNHTTKITTSQKITGMTYDRGDPVPHEETFKYNDKVVYEIGNGFGYVNKIEFARILSTDSFIKQIEATDSVKVSFSSKAKENVKKNQWVLMFDESEYKNSISMIGGVITKQVETGTFVSKVTLLRLMFEYNGTTYNLGVIDNKQTGDDEPGIKFENKTPIEDLLKQIVDTLKNIINFFKNYWIYIVFGIVGIIALILIAPFLPKILTKIGEFIVTIFKGLWWAICLPFNLFKNKNQENENIDE